MKVPLPMAHGSLPLFSSRIFLCAAIAGAAVVALLGWRLAIWWAPAPALPAVDTRGVEAEAAEAVRAALAEVEHHSRSATAWGNLGLTLFAHDFYGECVPCFAEAERQDAGDLRWPYFQGLALYNSDRAAAIACLRRAAAVALREATVQERLGEALLENGEIAEAETEFARALKVDPGHARALLGMGAALLRQGKPKEAIAYLRLTGDDPTTRKAGHTRLAEAYQQLGESERAGRERALADRLPEDIAAFDPLLEAAWAYQKGPRGRVRAGGVLLEQNRPEEAILLMQETVQQYPNADQAFLVMGKAFIQLGRYADAERALSQAHRIQPDAYQPIYLLGAAYFELKQYEKATDQFRAALRIKPDDATAHYNLGHCLLRRGDKAGAVAAWQTALRYRPSSAEIHFRLGDLLAQLGRTADALGHLDNAVQLDSSNVQYRQRRDEVKTKK
jgi:tetratricopeptide (TPR) repeat protein